MGGKAEFERSALPSREQLNLHVDGKNFLGLVHQPEGERLEIMAEEAHNVYIEQMGEEIKTAKPEEAAKLKSNPNYVAWNLLDEEGKEQNRDQVRDIFRKLGYAGCSMAPRKAQEPVYEFSKEMEEELACLEHTRWMRMKARKGWRYAAERNDKEKLQNCMLPWTAGDYSDCVGFSDVLGTDELPEKDKDRVAIRNIPRILKKGGYTILPPIKSQPEQAKKEQIEPGKEFPATVTIQPRKE